MSQIKAELIDSMGDDLTVVNAARVSFNKESCWIEDDTSPCTCNARHSGECACDALWGDKQGTLYEGDTKLIQYLATHNHFTPFTHPMITLRETVPIFVARQRFKHVVGFTYNEVSRRYVDNEPEFYTPDVWRSRPEGSAKQGSGGGEVIDIGNDSTGYGNTSSCYDSFITQALSLYSEMIESGVAPEQARMVLPQSMMTSYYVTGSLAAFARAYVQRKDSHAQKEIQDLAVQWDELIRPLFPNCWEALTK